MPGNDLNIYLSKFSGINNLQDEKSLNSDELVDAVNVDITRDGRIQSRTAWKNIRTCIDGHSLFSDNINMYFIDEDNLIQKNINGIENIIDTGYKGLRTSFIKDNNNIIISNDKFIKRFKNNKIYNMTPETYKNENLKVSFGNGNFPKGNYLISITFLHDDDVEGGTNPSISVKVNNDNSSIILNELQLTNDINIKGYRVYISQINGISLNHYSDYSIDTQEITLNYTTQTGKFLTLFNKDPMWPGSLIDKYRGVIYTAFKDIVYLSDPLGYTTNNNYLQFDGNITLLVSTVNGIYISDEYNLYFLNGNNPLDLTRVLIYNSPAIKYSQSKNIITNDIFFFTQSGQMIADPNGKITNITESKFLPDQKLGDGASLVMYQNGIRKIINSFNQGQKTDAAFGDWCKVDIIKANQF